MYNYLISSDDIEALNDKILEINNSYKLDFDVNNYKSIQLCEDVSYDYYQMFNGTSIKKNWKTLKVKYYEDDKELKNGDAPGFNIPVLKQKAFNYLFPLINGNVEILTLQLNDETLYGINVLNVIDAIDYDSSVYRTYRDGKRIMAFKKYGFREDMIKNKNIFKITDLPRGDIFVSEEFYKTIRDNNLEGFKLVLVYDSKDKGLLNE